MKTRILSSKNYISVIIAIAVCFLTFLTLLFFNIYIDDIKTNTENTQPALLLGFYVCILLCCTLSILSVVRTAFSISDTARIHTLGILKSVGASPRQIKLLVIKEMILKSLVPLAIGLGSGTVCCKLFMMYITPIAEKFRSSALLFYVHPMPLMLSALLALCIISFSAARSARHVNKMQPIAAIKSEYGELTSKKLRSPLLFALFGIEGELAGNMLKSQKKAFKTASFALLFSLLVFSVFLAFMTLSTISVKQTYFDRYKEIWDIEIDVAAETMPNKLLTETEFSACKNLIISQRFAANAEIAKKNIPETLLQNDTFWQPVSKLQDSYLVKAPILILDNKSFTAYIKQCTPTANADALQQGMVIVNRIWDSTHSSFRDKQYIPFITETTENIVLQDTSADNNQTVPVIAFAENPPALKGGYENYTLVCVISQSYWANALSAALGIKVPHYLITAKATNDEEVPQLQSLIEAKLHESGTSFSSTNRIQEEESDKEIKRVYILFVGFLCSLFALIGLSNVFFTVLNSVVQQQKQYACFKAVGADALTIRRVFALEALLLFVKPAAIALAGCVLFSIFSANASFLPLSTFFAQFPYITLILYLAAIALCIGFAFFLAEQKVKNLPIAEIIKQD